MISHLYRFRPVDAVLDQYEELAKQEIYFSPPEELNDPMEGYKDVFWCGDRIVWRNLLPRLLREGAWPFGNPAAGCIFRALYKSFTTRRFNADLIWTALNLQRRHDHDPACNTQ